MSEKKKKLNPIAVTLAVILALAVGAYAIFGGRKQYDIIGTWVVDSCDSGFQCGKQGIAASINDSRKQYNSWELNKGKLILKGKLFCNSQKPTANNQQPRSTVEDFCDTLIIINLNSQSMTVKHKDNTTHYQKIR